MESVSTMWDEYVSIYLFNDWIAFLAAASKSSSEMIFKPLFLIISLAFSMLVPCKRTMSGTLSLMVRQAFTIPLAMMAQLTIPPKMLTKMAFTYNRYGVQSAWLNSDIETIEGQIQMLT